MIDVSTSSSCVDRRAGSIVGCELGILRTGGRSKCRKALSGFPVRDKNAGLTLRLRRSLWFKNLQQPLKIHIRIVVARFATGEVPTRRRMHDPVAPVSRRKPNDERLQRSTSSRDAFHKVGSLIT